MGLGTKVLKPVERSRRALQNDAIRFVIGQSIFEQKAVQKSSQTT